MSSSVVVVEICSIHSEGLVSCFWLKQNIFYTTNIMERREYIILLIRTQETFHIYNVEPTNSMFQEIEVSHCVTMMWLGHHITGNCSTPVRESELQHVTSLVTSLYTETCEFGLRRFLKIFPTLTGVKNTQKLHQLRLQFNILFFIVKNFLLWWKEITTFFYL